MALREIIKEGDELLNKKCREVEKFDPKLAQLLDDMAETLYDADGVGLAAPQVGILRRICIIDIGNGLTEMINPVITAASGVQESSEGCLSCPGRFGITKRPKNITVQYQTRNNETMILKCEDLMAKAVCHEVDHLNGILFTEHVIEWQ